MQTHLILWQGVLLPGHEACRLFSQDSQWHLEGAAVFSHERTPCQFGYHIICDKNWRTLFADVQGWAGEMAINLNLRVDGSQHWWLNEIDVPGVTGCIDLDLNFSPSTNTIAIRRLNLAVGEHKETTAAWLRFPSFTLEPLPQSYQRVEENLYRYESGGGRFVANLVTDKIGFVTGYPGIWKAEEEPDQ